jgi:ABC-type spermidine/putrescine transport system permease subunit II
VADSYEAVSTVDRVSRSLQYLFAAGVFVFMFLPICVLVLFSFNANQFGAFPITGLTLRWYRDVFANTQIQDALMTSLQISAQVTVLAVVIGTAAAFPLSRTQFRFTSWLRLGFTLPLMIPGLIIGVSLLILFTQVFGMRLSPTTAMIGQTVFTTPFVVLIVAAQLDGINPALELAASDLGASRLQTLRHVTLPLLSSAILSGALFAFTLAMDEFIITMFLIGNDNTLPIYIYSQVRFGITPEVNALATLLLFGAILLLACSVVLPGALRAVQKRKQARSVALAESQTVSSS